MTCASDRTRATLRVAIVGLLALFGACTDGPNLPPEAEPALLAPDGPAAKIYPIAGVTGTASCPTNYISDGAGGCIYGPTVDDGWGTSGGTSTGGTTGTGGYGGSGGGGTTPSADDSDSPCDPAVDPDCEKPLTAADSATINKALNDYLRPAAQFTDSLARKDCEQMTQWFRDAMAAGAVFRGDFDSDATSAIGTHYGAYDPDTGHLHFEPGGLSAAASGNADALREVAITALHEAAHRAGKKHPAGPTFDSQGRDYYTDPPFNRLNPGANSCVPR